MAKKSEKKDKKKSVSEDNLRDAWLSMRTGLIIITVVSIGMAILTAWSAAKSQGTLEGILWGLGFGVAVWGVFIVALLFNWFVRGKRS